MSMRSVVLTEHQEAMIEKLVESGRYQNANEILGDGLRLIESKVAREAADLEALGTARAANEQVDEVLIREVRVAREKATRLESGEILALRDEGRRNE